jgi:3-hydroxy-9,10-secoandrosta-1,3,5(10)-triene-9,17-dione monooxygenase
VFLAAARARISTADQSKMELDPTVQEVAARATAELHAVRCVLAADMGAMMEAARRGERVSIEDRVRYRYASSEVVDRCVAVVDRLFENSGGRAIFTDHPMNRLFQDAHAARAHYANNPARPGRNLGRVLLGHKTQDYFL